jgi:hypothetical protein
MPVTKEASNNINKVDSGWKIHYSYLLTAVVAFVFGLIGILLLQNYVLKEKIILSTLDILNLVFSVGLSAASIVLAVTAIILSRKSEQAIMARSDEGIKCQTELFKETIDVLSKIKTSTGISEKRIEDMAQEIKFIEKSKPGSESRDDQVKDVLRRAFRSQEGDDLLKKAKARIDKEEEFTKSVMNSLKQTKGVEIIKIGSGDFDESGEKMVDGVFLMNGKRFSVSTFYSYGPAKIMNFADSDTYKQYFLNLASELSKNTFEKSFLAFNKDVNGDIEFKNLFDSTSAILDKKIVPKIVLVSGALEKITELIIKEAAGNA